MNCFLCFIDDKFQENLRSISQIKSERFEITLSDFQTNFFNEFNNLTSVNECPVHKNLKEITKNEAEKLQKKYNCNDLISFSNKLREIYIDWIKGNNKSITNLKNILTDYSILTAGVDLFKHVFFRGRKSEYALNREDLFHIPFNQRSKIKNQRYSISGQPILYLSLSPIPIIYELRSEILNFSDIYFCSFLHVGKEPLRILDLTNKYSEQFSDIELCDDPNKEFCEYILENDQNFYKFILTQFCSFKRNRKTENEVFSEEYVLSQLLTTSLREFNFNGIKYSSTRVENNSFISNAKFHVNKHRENVALFTSYQDTDLYDYDLLDQFVISKPQSISDLINFSFNDIDLLRQQIVKLNQTSPLSLPFSFRGIEAFGYSAQSIFDEFYVKDKQDLIQYFDHPIGKIHLQMIYQILLLLRNSLNPQN